MQVYLDGRWISHDRAVISPFNSAALYGETVFEAVPLYGGKPLFFEDHLKRMSRGCRFLGWRSPSQKEVMGILNRFAVQWGGKGNFLVRLGLVQEMGPKAGPKSFNGQRPVLFANTRPLRHDPSAVVPACGNVGVAHWRLPSPFSYPFGFKTAFYLTARREMLKHPGWDEMLRLSAEGDVADGFSSTPILIQGKRIFASPVESGGLKSVTQEHVLQHCRKRGFQIARKGWRPADIFRRKSELIFVGSGVGIFAAKSLQGKFLLAPGPVTVDLWNEYQKWIKVCSEGK